MLKELMNGNNKWAFLLLFSLFAITIIFIGIDQPIKFITANKQAVSWILWIALYILAQFIVAVFVGRMIRGTN